MSEVYNTLLAFIGWCSWMAEPAVWVIFFGAVGIASAVWIVARERWAHRWSGPQYRRGS